MRISLIFFFHAICIFASKAALYETIIDDLEILIEHCSSKGRQMEPRTPKECERFNLTDDMLKNHRRRRFCQNAFEISCLQKLDNYQCSFGEKLARKGGECYNVIGMSKKCCLACKIGLELKQMTGECFPASSFTSDNIKNVTANCCNRRSDNYSSYESDNYNNEIIVYDYEKSPIINDFVPAAIIATQKSSTSLFCGVDEERFKTSSGYECKCKNGFSEGDEPNECVDVDECQDNPCAKLNRTCINTQGSFKCDRCISGYEYDYEETCVDINECDRNICKKNEVCTNLNGEFRCTEIICPPRYKMVNATSCKLKSCATSVCHETIHYFFKTVSPSDNNIIVHEFSATSVKANMDSEFFQIIPNGQKRIVKIRKPLKQDFTLKFFTKRGNKGRKQVIEKVFIFVSKK